MGAFDTTQSKPPRYSAKYMTHDGRGGVLVTSDRQEMIDHLKRCARLRWKCKVEVDGEEFGAAWKNGSQWTWYHTA